MWPEAQLFTRCSLLVIKSLLTCLKIRSLLFAEVARCKNSPLIVAKFARYSLQKLLVAKLYKLLVAKIHSLLIAKFESFSFFNIICFLEPKNSKLFYVNILIWNLLLAKHFPKQQYTNGQKLSNFLL